MPITPARPVALRGPALDAARRRFLAVREDHRATGEPRQHDRRDPARRSSATRRVLVEGPTSSPRPRLSPDGDRLAWLEWDHPNMPWDATRLRRRRRSTPTARSANRILVAGGPDESIAQPEWSPDGVLHFVSDRSGWWNLYRLRRRAAPRAARADGGRVRRPGLGLRALVATASCADGSIVAVGRDRRHGPAVPHRSRATLHRRGRDAVHGVRRACVVGRTRVVTARRVARRRPSVVRARPGDPGAGRRPPPRERDRPRPGRLSIPEPIEFPTTGGRTAHALLLPAANPEFVGPDGERPPLIVPVHGGPTSNALDRARPRPAVPDQPRDRRRRRRLRRQHRLRPRVPPASSTAQWGVVDVDDCVAAARFLAERGDVDPRAAGDPRRQRRRLHDPGRARVPGRVRGRHQPTSASATSSSSTSDTHKFESRYTRPPGRAVSGGGRASTASDRRVHYADQITCPVLDPPGRSTTRSCRRSQAEPIVAALAANAIPHAYLAFEGEGHGFRGADALRRTLEAELSFLGQVFGFEPADEIEPLDMPGLDAWLARAPKPDGPASPAPGCRSEPCRHRRGVRRRLMELDRLEFGPSSWSSACSSSSSPWRTSPAGWASPIRSCSSCGGLDPRVCPWPPDDRARAGCRLPAAPAADPVRCGLLRHRSATSRPTRGRSRCWRSGSCCSRRSSSVASCTYLVPSMGLAAAFALGAIVAPPDAVAATSIFRRLGVPRRGSSRSSRARAWSTTPRR